MVLGDGPSLEREAVARVAARIALGDAPLVGARYASGRAHPVAIARELWPRLPRRGEDGARALGVAPVEVDCTDLTAPGDADTPDAPLGSALFAAALEALAKLFATPLLVARPAAALLDVLAEARLEPVCAAAVDALGEVRLDAAPRLGRQHPVEVALHGQLGLGAAVDNRLVAHETAPVSRDCASCVFSMRRPR